MKFSRAVMAFERLVPDLGNTAKVCSIELKCEANKHVPF